jgi:probable HAF family extracellular repeat protein
MKTQNEKNWLQRTLQRSAATALLFALAMPVGMAAQDNQEQKHQHRKYKLVDLGTFGGPASYFLIGFADSLNNQGTAAGWADTSTPDPYPAFCFNPDCFVSHAFQGQEGVTDLGVLPGGSSSQAFGASANGLIIGNSQNGEIDPLVPGFPEVRGVFWKQGEITDLGTLEGGHESLAAAVNNSGQVVGAFNNTIPDPFSLLGNGYQVKAFLWQKGAMQDLGTLGGPDAFASFVNERGQIAGNSFINSTPNPVTGIPTIDCFIWEDGKMVDVPTLGGTVASPNAFNNQGQLVGVSNLAGDLTFHPFLWDKGGDPPLTDLDTLGGDTGTPNWINDVGEVVGKADLPGSQTHDAFLWSNGVMTDLGTQDGDPCSNAIYINSKTQIVGSSSDCVHGLHAFLWEKGGPMVDLNTLIPPYSSLTLVYGTAINDRGEIAGLGVPSGCQPADVGICGHALLLIPDGDCDEDCEGRIAASQNNAAPARNPATMKQGSESPISPVNQFRNRLMRRYHIPGYPAVPMN